MRKLNNYIVIFLSSRMRDYVCSSIVIIRLNHDDKISDKNVKHLRRWISIKSKTLMIWIGLFLDIRESFFTA